MTATFAAAKHETSIRVELSEGWELASTTARVAPESIKGLSFIPAGIPGTVASALRDQGAWRFGDATRFDASEHWFRCRFESAPPQPDEQIFLEIGGIATVADVSMNGEPILHSTSMFARHRVNVTHLLRGGNELLIACRSLSDALREKRSSLPAARWRTRVVADQQLRWFRTTLLGRAPGFAPEPEPVGPWRPIVLVRQTGAMMDQVSTRAEIDGSDGVFDFHGRIHPLHETRSGRLIVGDAFAPLEFDRDTIRATVRIPKVRAWWPHTNGSPVLYRVRVELDLPDGSIAQFDQRPAGFRFIRFSDGFEINGSRIFARGIVWTPMDPVSLAANPAAVRERLMRFRDAGFNLIRVAGTMVYEDDVFHSLCDELGLLVWQDMMFANMDYPFGDADFLKNARTEAAAELGRLATHPSTALICGNSEIEQQATMLGLDPTVSRAPFFAADLPPIINRVCPGVPYIRSAPSGGDLPFRTRAGVANYFGVGAYLRPLEDARRAEVRFASECLAFSNVPEPEMIEKMSLATRGGISPTHPAWKRAVPRDSGAGWDFEDVRDHYLKLLYGVDPASLRCCDVPRYWELSRITTGEIMAEVFGEWRRAGSSSSGGIILWGADLEPGAGWGILDSQGWPKAPYWFLKRALAPVAVWTTDEGLNGIDIHAANDTPQPFDAALRVALYRSDLRVAEGERNIRLDANSTIACGVEQILNRFVDAAWAYRFGPSGHDVIAVTLLENSVPLARAFRLPAGRPIARVPVGDLGLSAQARCVSEDAIELSVETRRFAWGVRAAAPGWLPDDAYFAIEPGGSRQILLRRVASARAPQSIAVTAVNADGRLNVAVGSAG